MARIRSIRPEFWESEDIAGLSRDARLLFIATWTAADDEGLLRWNPAYLKSVAFIYDADVTVEHVEGLMVELVQAGLVAPYQAGKSRQSLALITGFHKYQKPNRPQPSKFPKPPPGLGEYRKTAGQNGCAVDSESFTDSFTESVSEPFTPGIGIGDGEGVEKTLLSGRPDDSDQVRELFDLWVETTGRTERTKLTDDRRGLIRRRIRQHGFDACRDAVLGWALSEWHRGANPDGRVYDDISLILRDASKIEGFGRLLTEPPKPRSAAQVRQDRSVDVLRRFAGSEPIALEA